MSLKRNLASNYVGQAYTAAVTMVMLPMYVRYMGAESFGLIGFFAMLQAWGQVLDLGLTPSLSRELSRTKAGVADLPTVAAMVRATEWLFGLLGLGVAAMIAFAATWIAREWLKPHELSFAEMQRSVVLMGITLGLRWLIALYRGGLTGLERIVALNVVAIVFATLRSVGVIAILILWTTRPSGFFGYQVVVSVLELLVTQAVFYRGFPMSATRLLPGFRMLRALFVMAGSMAFLTALWIIINQTDKFVLSGTVALNKYGFYTLAVTLATGITLLATPMAQALQPRFTLLVAAGENDRVTRLYRTSTQATVATMGALAGVMVCFAEPLVRAWTGNPDVAREAGRVLPMFAAGNLVAAVLSLAFLLQFAQGFLRWHIAGNCLFALAWFPSAIWAARHSGAVGVGWVWLTVNLVYLLFWLPFIFRWLLPGLWWRWLTVDIGLIVVVEAGLFYLATRLPLTGFGRVMEFAVLALVGAIVAGFGLLVGSETRAALRRGAAGLLATRGRGSPMKESP